MGKVENKSKYEMMLIVDELLTADEKESILRSVTEAIEKEGGKVVSNQVWAEKQKFTYEIKKCKEGTYYLIILEGVPGLIRPVETKLRLNEKILRFGIVKLSKQLAAA